MKRITERERERERERENSKRNACLINTKYKMVLYIQTN